MEKRKLGKTGMDISIISFGGMIVDGMDAADAAKAVSEAYDRGINYYDIAPTYGNSQYVLGPALEAYRKNVYLSCKTKARTATEAQAALEKSLRALKTDYFDIYQLHGLDDAEGIKTTFASGGVMEALIRAKEKGYIRNIGVTCHRDAAVLEILRNYSDFATLMFPINYGLYIKKGIGVITLKACAENDIGFIAIKPLARRDLFQGEVRALPGCWYYPIHDNPELARLALNFTLSQEVSTAIPPGDIKMLQIALTIIEKQGGKSIPLTNSENIELKGEVNNMKHFLLESWYDSYG